MFDLPPPLVADREPSGTPMLPAQWLDETLARARTLLHRDDPFMRALERQREPLGAAPPASAHPADRPAEEEAVEGAGLSFPV